MQRRLQPEILDTLSPDDPAALRNRRDLRLINRAMGTARWFTGELQRRVRPAERILEIGAGTGDLGRHLRARGFLVDGLDLWPRPADWPADAAWHQADLRKFEGYSNYSVILASLIFHQFDEADLAEIGSRLSHARVLLASEPARKRRAKVFLAVGGAVLGANYVTRHDARVSVEAGFLRDELPRFLRMDRSGWSWQAAVYRLGFYRLTAERL
ncbi:MAG TPA: hypothetical protein VGL42_15995 [Opitutaceae bacterium]|jgi:SAM-dependent methyltransferase